MNARSQRLCTWLSSSNLLIFIAFIGVFYCSKLMGIFREESNWVLSFLHVLILDTRLIASSVWVLLSKSDWHWKAVFKADQQAARKAGEEIHDNLRNAEQHLKKTFAMAANDRAPLEQSKQLGSLHIVDQLFKIYFKVSPISKPLLMCGKLVLCSSIRFICVEIWYEPLKVRHSRLLSDSAEPIKSRISITLDVSQCLKISITKRRNAWIMLGNILVSDCDHQVRFEAQGRRTAR